MRTHKEFETTGRLWVRAGLSSKDLATWNALTRDATGPGLRLPSHKHLSEAAQSISRHVDPYLPNARPVRFVAFSKSKEAVWGVPWHQDCIIAVEEKTTLDGYTNWTHQTLFWHCEPPIELLANMLFVQVYLDPATPENGCLEIAHGSHEYGKIEGGDIQSIIENCDTEVCAAEPGDILILTALTLHRSRKATAPSQRRAIRIDYSADRLPTPLKWAY